MRPHRVLAFPLVRKTSSRPTHGHRRRSRAGHRRVVNTDIDVNHINNLGWTALMETVLLGDGTGPHQEIVKILLDAGADPTIADRDGVTPAQHAKANDFDEIAQLLENH